ncbi:hypothetical protein SteCoe_37496 [Stentor coeruleus]|uniref:RecQ mediated genome instability protein 1 OB-fold domain-containing protein n=1 Tax=Stentor coeruleus TaxID=5963 RepID=A0A1R2AN87_9CILI|nr:hypothetical protein SteCoe_37496 [Stentor coeruleus]
MNYIELQGYKIELKKIFSSEKEAYTALLTENIEEVYSGCSEIRGKNDGILNSVALFEVVSVRDIGKRIGDESSNNHTYLLVLTDGVNEIQGFEYTSWDFEVEAGNRVLLLPPIKLKRGLLLLGSENIISLTKSV